MFNYIGRSKICFDVNKKNIFACRIILFYQLILWYWKLFYFHFVWLLIHCCKRIFKHLLILAWGELGLFSLLAGFCESSHKALSHSCLPRISPLRKINLPENILLKTWKPTCWNQTLHKSSLLQWWFKIILHHAGISFGVHSNRNTITFKKCGLMISDWGYCKTERLTALMFSAFRALQSFSFRFSQQNQSL